LDNHDSFCLKLTNYGYLIKRICSLHPKAGQEKRFFTRAVESHGLWPWMNAPALGRDVAPLGRSLGATGFARGAPLMVGMSCRTRCGIHPACAKPLRRRQVSVFRIPAGVYPDENRDRNDEYNKGNYDAAH